ncbi:MAG: hypothetical protein IPJ97_17975 [Proteobacteria bacterium]|nr:hypothetical protein [Pseudomonadota bacterium]
MPTDFLSLFAVINAAQVPYVVVGGLAMLLHGIDRVTGNIDLVIDLAPGPSTDLVTTLINAGYRSFAPVDPALLANEAIREQWRLERGMEVFSLWDSTNRRPTVDVLLACPIPFTKLLNDSVIVTLGAVQIRVASVAHLMDMKQQTARPRDLKMSSGSACCNSEEDP